MTQVQTRPEAETARQVSWSGVGLVSLVAALGAGLTWTLWTQAGRVALTTRSNGRTADVGIAAVLISTVLIVVAGAVLLRALNRWTRRGLLIWTIIATMVMLLSFPGPLQATTATATTALASLHVVVGVVTILGLRRLQPDTGRGE